MSIDTKKRLFSIDRTLFKWLTSKVMTQLLLLRWVIGVEISRQFVNQWEAKPKPNAPCKLDFSRAFSNLLVTARNSDCFIALFASVVIGRSSYVDVGFTTANWNRGVAWEFSRGNFWVNFSKGHFNKWRNTQYKLKLRHYKCLLPITENLPISKVRTCVFA